MTVLGGNVAHRDWLYFTKDGSDAHVAADLDSNSLCGDVSSRSSMSNGYHNGTTYLDRKTVSSTCDPKESSSASSRIIRSTVTALMREELRKTPSVFHPRTPPPNRATQPTHRRQPLNAHPRPECTDLLLRLVDRTRPTELRIMQARSIDLLAESGSNPQPCACTAYHATNAA